MSQIDRRTLMAAGAAALIPAQAAARSVESRWTPRRPMPWAIQEIYCVALEGRIVIAGGLAARPDGFHIEDRTAVYEPANDRWAHGPSLPQPRHHPMIAAAGGRLLAMGGYGRGSGGDWTAMTDCWAMNGPGWRPVAPLPEPLCETVGATLEDRVHLVTGRKPKGEANGQWNDQGDVTDHRVFDPAANRWETARPVPMARNSAAGAVLDGVLYVAGGRTVEGGGTGRLDRYDPGADRWDTLTPIPPSPVSGQQVGGGLAMGALHGQLVAFGGEWFAPGGGGGVFAETWIYEPASDRWTAGPAMRTPRHGLAGAVIEGALYAIGGGEVVGGGRASAVVEMFQP